MHVSVPPPSHNTALDPKRQFSPIFSIEGLLRLVALVAQYGATLDWNTQEGSVCQSNPLPPASRASSDALVASITAHPSTTTGSSPQSNDDGSDRISGAEGGQQ